MVTYRNGISTPTAQMRPLVFFFCHFVRMTLLGMISKAKTQLSCCRFIHTPLAEASHMTKASPRVGNAPAHSEARQWFRLLLLPAGQGLVHVPCKPLPAWCCGVSTGLSSAFNCPAFHTCLLVCKSDRAPSTSVSVRLGCMRRYHSPDGFNSRNLFSHSSGD